MTTMFITAVFTKISMQRYLINYGKNISARDITSELRKNEISDFYLHNVTLGVIGAYVPENKIARSNPCENLKGLEHYTVLADPIPEKTASGNSVQSALPHLLVPKI